MMIQRSKLKSQARQAMKLACPNAWRMTMVYLLLTSGISLLVSLFFLDPITRLAELAAAGLPLPRALLVTLSETGSTGLFFHVLSLIFIVVLDFGYHLWCLGTTRGGIGEWWDLFGGFSMVGRVVLLRLVVLLYCFILYACALMLTLTLTGLSMFFGFFGLLAAIPLFLAAILFTVWRMLHYNLASFCLMDDPDKGVFHAVNQSRALMRGHCWQFILLALSFLGWGLLAVLIQLLASSVLAPLLGFSLPFAGGSVLLADLLAVVLVWPFHAWLTCYYTMSICRFYDTLRGDEQVDS